MPIRTSMVTCGGSSMTSKSGITNHGSSGCVASKILSETWYNFTGTGRQCSAYSI